MGTSAWCPTQSEGDLSPERRVGLFFHARGLFRFGFGLTSFDLCPEHRWPTQSVAHAVGAPPAAADGGVSYSIIL